MTQEQLQQLDTAAGEPTNMRNQKVMAFLKSQEGVKPEDEEMHDDEDLAEQLKNLEGQMAQLQVNFGVAVAESGPGDLDTFGPRTNLNDQAELESTKHWQNQENRRLFKHLSFFLKVMREQKWNVFQGRGEEFYAMDRVVTRKDARGTEVCPVVRDVLDPCRSTPAFPA